MLYILTIFQDIGIEAYVKKGYGFPALVKAILERKIFSCHGKNHRKNYRVDKTLSTNILIPFSI